MLAERSTEDVKPLSRAVLEAVALAEETDPAELAEPLYDAIDPEALDDLFRPSGQGGSSRGQVAFVYHDYVVTACSTGRVDIRPVDGVSPRQ